MKKRLLLACIFYCFSFFLFAQTKEYRPEFFTVIDTGKVSELLSTCSRSVPQNLKACWVITTKEISILEKNFQKIYDRIGDECCTVNNLSFFAFQYLGIWKDSLKCIYINAFPKNTIKEFGKNKWKTMPLDVCGGGEYYWGGLFNIDSKQFIFLDFNGPK